MRAVVLVGGFGTRLRPLTLTTPKPLLPLGQRRILDHLVEHLAGHGVTEVVLSIGFKPDAFRAAYPDDECEGVRLAYAVEPEPLDTAGAIRFAADAAGIDGRFLVANGDVLTDLDIGALVALHEARGGEATIHLTPVEDPSAFGVVAMDGDGLVHAFIEKPRRETAPSNLINAGTYVLEPAVLERIPGGRRVSIERETFPALVADGALFALATSDYWLDAGRPEEYLRANLDTIDAVRRRVREAPVAADAVVERSADVRHSVVGARAVVAEGAQVQDSLLMPGATVGAGASVKRSVVGAGARVGPKASLVDAVVGDGVAVAAGAQLAAVRVPA